MEKICLARVLWKLKGCVWLDRFEGIYCSRGWIWVDEDCLVDLVWEDGSGERFAGLDFYSSKEIWWDLKGWNWKLWNKPYKWSGNYEIPLTLEITNTPLIGFGIWHVYCSMLIGAALCITNFLYILLISFFTFLSI